MLTNSITTTCSLQIYYKVFHKAACKVGSERGDILIIDTSPFRPSSQLSCHDERIAAVNNNIEEQIVKSEEGGYVPPITPATPAVLLIFLDYIIEAKMLDNKRRANRGKDVGEDLTNDRETDRMDGESKGQGFSLYIEELSALCPAVCPLSAAQVLFLTRAAGSVVRDLCGSAAQNPSQTERDMFDSFVAGSSGFSRTGGVNSNHRINGINSVNCINTINGANAVQNTNSSSPSSSSATAGGESEGAGGDEGRSEGQAGGNREDQAECASEEGRRPRVKASPSHEEGVSVLEFFSGIG